MKTHHRRARFESFRWLAGVISAFVTCVSSHVDLLAQEKGEMRPIDLMGHYTRTLGAMPAHEFWAEVPDGLVDFDGRPFDCRGILELTGMTGFDSNNIRPAHIGNISVVDRADVIHLLSSTTWTEQTGVVIARMTLRYEDGTMAMIPIAQGVHTEKFWQSENPNVISSDSFPNKKKVWNINSRRSSSLSLNLFRASFPNPRPEALIESIDFESAFSQSMPVILGLTLEKNPRLREAVLENQADEPELDLEANIGEVVNVRLLTKGEGKPVSEAVLVATSRVPGVQLNMGTYRPNHEGLIQIRLPRRDFVAVDLEVSAKGLISFRDTLARGAEGLPDEYSILMDQGTPIGGFVEDVRGNAIGGASVSVDVISRDSAGNFFLAAGFPVETAENGTWSQLVELSGEGDLTLRVEHPDYLAMQFELPPSRSPYTITRRELREKTALMVMLPAPKMEGRVVSTGGAAVPNAVVRLFDPVSFQLRKTSRTNDKGQFEFSLNHQHPVLLLLQKDGFAPHSEVFATRSGINEIDVALRSGASLKQEVVDEEGEPVRGARIALVSWNGQELLEWEGESDGSGYFHWNGAPAGKLNFRVRKPGYDEVTAEIQTGSPSQAIVIPRQPHVFGRVVSKETGEPIKRFVAVPGRAYSMAQMEDPVIHWAHHFNLRGANGTFTFDPRRLGGGNARIRFKIQADGYLPFESELIQVGGATDLVVELEPGRDLDGVVRTPDGSPLSEVRVIAVPAGHSVPFTPGKLELRTDLVNTVTDAEGAFRLSPQPDDVTLLFIHDSGIAELAELTDDRLRDVRLSGWAAINGQLKSRSRPSVEGETVYAFHRFDRGPGRKGFPIHAMLRTKVDSAGRFSFSKLPPGEYEVGRMFPTGDTRMEASHGFGTRLAENATTQVEIGAEGSLVTGTMKLIGEEWPDIEWSEVSGYLTLQLESNRPAAPVLDPQLPNDVIKRRQQEFAEKLMAFERSGEAVAEWRARRQYLIRFESDGRFRVEDVPSGKYIFQIYPRGNENSVATGEETWSKLTRSVLVEGGGVGSQTSVDLGELEFRWSEQ